MTTISYVTRYDEATGRVHGPLTPAEARRRHSAGQPYTAVVDRPGQPTYLVVVDKDTGYVTAERLGAGPLPVAELHFELEDDGQLFCDLALRRGGHAHETATIFRPDGQTSRIEHDPDGSSTTRHSHVDVTANRVRDWGFGRYERLLAFEQLVTFEQVPAAA